MIARAPQRKKENPICNDNSYCKQGICFRLYGCIRGPDAVDACVELIQNLRPFTAPPPLQ
jgi:hypothetical protein